LRLSFTQGWHAFTVRRLFEARPKGDMPPRMLHEPLTLQGAIAIDFQVAFNLFMDTISLLQRCSQGALPDDDVT